MNEVSLTVSEFIAIFNQTLEVAYPSVTIIGELANFRISKNTWVYFDLKDETGSLKFFGSVYALPGPLENGLMLKVTGQPRLHNRYGFSVNILSIMPSGEGSLKKAADLLKAKLEREGLFDPARKRRLAYPPRTIGLITSIQSAAYADFIKILNARWRGVALSLIDVQVQGELAGPQIVAGLEHFSAQSRPPEVVVLIRGGGSAEDLAAFSSEQVTRAVAASRVPTLVAIGHEIDVSLAELAADQRASTPSNAAELLVPDRYHSLKELSAQKHHLKGLLENHLRMAQADVKRRKLDLSQSLKAVLRSAAVNLKSQASLIEAFNPSAILRRGYAIVRTEKGAVLRHDAGLKIGDIVGVQLYKGQFAASVKSKGIGKRNNG